MTKSLTWIKLNSFLIENSFSAYFSPSHFFCDLQLVWIQILRFIIIYFSYCTSQGSNELTNWAWTWFMILNKSKQRKWSSFETLAEFYKMESTEIITYWLKASSMGWELNKSVYYIRYILVTKICNNLSFFVFLFL